MMTRLLLMLRIEENDLSGSRRGDIRNSFVSGSDEPRKRSKSTRIIPPELHVQKKAAAAMERLPPIVHPPGSPQKPRLYSGRALAPSNDFDDPALIPIGNNMVENASSTLPGGVPLAYEQNPQV